MWQILLKKMIESRSTSQVVSSMAGPFSNQAISAMDGSILITVLVPETTPDTPPTITLKAPILLGPPNHEYQAVDISQMVQSASDAKDGDLINSVVIEKVTSDEPDKPRVAPMATPATTS